MSHTVSMRYDSNNCNDFLGLIQKPFMTREKITRNNVEIMRPSIEATAPVPTQGKLADRRYLSNYCRFR